MSEKKVIPEKKIKLEKEPMHAASSPVNKIITKNTASLRSSPRLQNRNGNFSSQEKTVFDDKKSISIKDLEKETTDSLIGVEEQTFGRIEHVESLKMEPEATESSVSAKQQFLDEMKANQQLLDDMKAFEELLLKAKEKNATNSFSTLSETSEALNDDNDF